MFSILLINVSRNKNQYSSQNYYIDQLIATIS